jgi:YVTN family beta-propeller protein
MRTAILTAAAGARRFCPSALLFSVLFAAAGALQMAAFAQPRPATGGYHLAATWKPGGDGGWDYLNVDPRAHRLYVTRTDRVQVLDTEDGTLVGEVMGLDGGHGVALALDQNRGFVSSGKSNTVIVFDLKTLKAIGEPIPVGKKPDAIVYDPASKHVFAFDGGSDEASVIDAATAKVVATIALGGGPEFAAADGRGTVFVNLEDKNMTLAIDARNNTVTHHWPLAPGESPSGLAIDTARRRLFAGCHNEQMVVLDAESGQVLATPGIGRGVDACWFDPGTGSAFASCSDGTLTVVQEQAPGDFQVIEKVTTRKSARTMALDTESHAIYLAAADLAPAPPAVAGAPHVHPPIIPGSFVILKFVR